MGFTVGFECFLQATEQVGLASSRFRLDVNGVLKVKNFMTPSQCQAIWICSNSISVVSWVANIFSGLLALRITNNGFYLCKRNQHEISSNDTIYFKILRKNEVAEIISIGGFKPPMCRKDWPGLFISLQFTKEWDRRHRIESFIQEAQSKTQTFKSVLYYTRL